MKLMKWTLTLAALSWFGTTTFAQEEEDSLGVIGDNLDLYAVLDAFKESESIEAFEKILNDPNSKINNLDLNEDDEVDFIQVHDEEEDGAHAFILRIDISETESQDVAVIELEKTGNEEATIQIVGDEEIYGKDYIVEPKGDAGVTERLMMIDLIIINVWRWPVVRFVYGPSYVRWRSPYRWGLYPKWWKPWRPFKWRAYHSFHKHHRTHYHVVHVRRCHRSHNVFVKKRRTAVVIHNHKHHHSHHPHKNPGTKNPGGAKQPIKGGHKKSSAPRRGGRRR